MRRVAEWSIALHSKCEIRASVPMSGNPLTAIARSISMFGCPSDRVQEGRFGFCLMAELLRLQEISTVGCEAVDQAAGLQRLDTMNLI
jgi:hypothetical protein